MSFNIGDIVIVLKLTTTNKKGQEKVEGNARDPYEVNEAIEQGMYNIQCIPFTEDQGRPGKLINENGVRMEEKLSTIVVHRMIDGAEHNMQFYCVHTSPIYLNAH